MTSSADVSPTTLSLPEFARKLPKVELHVHLEGSLPPDVLLPLAYKHGLEGVPRTEEQLAEWYEFRDFPHFVEIFETAIEALRDADDYALLTREVGRRLAAQNVRYAEVTCTTPIPLARDISATEFFPGIERGRREAEREYGISIRWITDFAGQLGPEAGAATLDAVLASGLDSVVGFGVGGIEVGSARGEFREVFARARDAGLHCVPHAGETDGPHSMWAAIRDLRAERIGHGISCVRDPELLAYLQRSQLPLEVSPTSNLRTGAVASPAEHPLARMLDEGLFVTINSDDPPMFGTDLTREYEVAAELAGLDAQGLAALARNAVTASFLDDAEKVRLSAEIDALAASSRVVGEAEGRRGLVS